MQEFKTASDDLECKGREIKRLEMIHESLKKEITKLERELTRKLWLEIGEMIKSSPLTGERMVIRINPMPNVRGTQMIHIRWGIIDPAIIEWAKPQNERTKGGET